MAREWYFTLRAPSEVNSHLPGEHMHDVRNRCREFRAAMWSQSAYISPMTWYFLHIRMWVRLEYHFDSARRRK
ncbi:hypothetical protein PSCLAVI8L_70086 [Pseudoclavibacter sp. 8L]|nr:hypothetical protein PSCLAVI8L_70086 [Pseudoclavibacter sp. 8L]